MGTDSGGGGDVQVVQRREERFREERMPIFDLLMFVGTGILLKGKMVVPTYTYHSPVVSVSLRLEIHFVSITWDSLHRGAYSQFNLIVFKVRISF